MCQLCVYSLWFMFVAFKQADVKSICVEILLKKLGRYGNIACYLLTIGSFEFR